MKKKVIVLKVGSNVVTTNGGVSLEILRLIARQVASAREQGYAVVIVSSGAVSCGKVLVTDFRDDIDNIAGKQVAASYGQPLLMQCWRQVFLELGIEKVGQCLETHDAFENGTAVRAIQNILIDGGVPIINENDAVNTEELRVLQKSGDNDQLSAIVAEHLDARRLIMLTNVDGLYRPVDNRLELVPVLHEITDEVLTWVGLLPTDRETGMRSKLIAAGQSMAKGIDVWIANGFKEVVPQILAGEQVGTRCLSR